jgi:hypothetical protein
LELENTRVPDVEIPFFVVVGVGQGVADDLLGELALVVIPILKGSGVEVANNEFASALLGRRVSTWLIHTNMLQ